VAGGAVAFSNFLSEVLIFVSFYQEKEKEKNFRHNYFDYKFKMLPY